MISFTDSSTMIDETKKAKKQFNPTINVLISIALVVILKLSVSLFYYIAYNIYASNGVDKSSIFNPYMPNNLLSVTSLFITVILIILCILYCTRIEKRSLRSMGLIKKGIFKQYSLGLIIGFSMFSAVILILVTTGKINYADVTGSFNPIIILYFLGYLFQGASEEFLCRGFLLNSIAARNGVIAAIIINSTVFGALHFLNPGFTFLAFINVILVGIFFSIYALKTDNIIGACAIHSMWNFTQSNIYGLSVSGSHLSPSVLKFTSFHNSILVGGKFGSESGLACTIVLLISIILTLYIPKKPTAASN